MNRLFTVFSSFAFVLSLSSISSASNYPGDMEIKSSCIENGPVKVCRGLQYPGLAVLNIFYAGKLLHSPSLKVWIGVNYLDGVRQGTFDMRPYNPPPYDTTAYTRITGGCLKGIPGGCAEQGTAEMRDLLLWAQTMGFTLNALSLDLAFVSDDNWDNNNSFMGTYHFEFPQN